jgi:hypothetical protein
VESSPYFVNSCPWDQAQKTSDLCSASLPAATIHCKGRPFESIVSKRILTNPIFLNEAQRSDEGAPKMTAHPHPAFDMEEHFERFAETYEEVDICTKDASRDLIKLAPPPTKDSIVHGNGCGPGMMVGEILNGDFLTDFPLSSNQLLSSYDQGGQTEGLERRPS